MAAAPDGDAAAGAKRNVAAGDDGPPGKVARLSDLPTLSDADLTAAAAAAASALLRPGAGAVAGGPEAAGGLQSFSAVPRTTAADSTPPGPAHGPVVGSAAPNQAAVANLQALLQIQQLQQAAKQHQATGFSPNAAAMRGQSQMLGQLNRQFPPQQQQMLGQLNRLGVPQHAPQQYNAGMQTASVASAASTVSAGGVNPLLMSNFSSSGLPGGLPAGHPNAIVTQNFEVPSAKVKDILGVKGMNIRAVKQRSGIQKITILDRSEPATVSVTGTESQIQTCKYLVLQIASGDQTCVGNATEAITIDAHLVPRIIGPRGQTITAMKDQSGAYIEVRKNPGQQQQVICTGPPDAVQAAKVLVLQFLAEQGMAGAGGAGGDFGGAAGSPTPESGGAMEQYAAQIQMAQFAAQLPSHQQRDIAQALQGGGVQQQQFNQGGGMHGLGQQLQGLQELQGLQNLFGIAEQQLLAQHIQGGQAGNR